MNRSFLHFFRKPKPSKLEQFLANRPHMRLTIEEGVSYIEIHKHVKIDGFFFLMKFLREEKYELAFHDAVHPTISDPGAYFSYSTIKSQHDNHWSMTYGNHGWSGGIYQISPSTVAGQILSLIKKEELTRLQISKVIFLSNYESQSKEKSKAKDAEIREMHSTMSVKEIVNRMSSKESHQIWEASCEIVSLGQDRKAIEPLIPFLAQLKEITSGIDLGGALASNQRFLDSAFKTLEFHRDYAGCTCHLYGIHECMNPATEVTKGNLTIENTVKIDGNWIDYYEAICTRCHQRFQIEEREGHHQWWDWKRLN